jgi:hypothetical protein
MSRSHWVQRFVPERALPSSNSVDTQERALKVFMLRRRTCYCHLRGLSEALCASPGAPRNVLSFLVTFFFARAKKEVTRSSAGGVEALLQEWKKEGLEAAAAKRGGQNSGFSEQS